MVSNILTIAKQEVKRVKTRFKGEASPVVMVVMVAALIISYLAFRQGPILSKGIYRIGISADGPAIEDARFSVVELDPEAGSSMLHQRAIDAYIDGDKVTSREDRKSLYALGALKRYLEKQELARIVDEVEIDKAFPLRIEVNYLPEPELGPGATGQISLADLLGPLSTPEGGAGMAETSTTQATPEGVGQPSESDSAVRKQIRDMEAGGALPKIDLEFASDKEIIVPSLMTPPMPFAQVIVAFFYILPVSFISVFFVSSFMQEKTDRRISVLMSAPIRPFEVIAGKMLPYTMFSLAFVVIITLFLRGDVLLALAIFTPVIMFIFAIYLMVPFLCRTFKDTTFISMLAVALTTSYLVFPAMFAGINDFSYISPLTLAVKMYRQEPFGLRVYLFSVTPMVVLFFVSMYVGTRILNEEYLMGFRPLHRKLAEAIYLAMDRKHPHVSIPVLSLALVPLVYMAQLVALAMSTNVPTRYAVGVLLVAGAIIEEIAKSIGVAVLLGNKHIRSTKDILVLSFLSALGFLISEKGLLYVSLKVVSETALSAAYFSSGLLLIPLIAHFAFTSVVGLLTKRLGARRYLLAVLAGSTIHVIYNLVTTGVIP